MNYVFKILLLFVFLATQGCAISIISPQIKGKKLSKSGATSNKNVRCVLRKGHIEGTVNGQVIVTKGFLDLGVNLSALNKEGRLICSWSIQPDESKKGKVSYWFILQEDLVEGATLSLFTVDEGMIELPLNTVRVLSKKKS